MRLELKLYIAAVAVAAATLITLFWPPDLAARWIHYLVWTAICVASEALWVPTASGTGTITMASTAGLAATMLWGRDAAIVIAVVSTAIADSLILKKPAIRVFFNSCQIAITTACAATAFAVLGGPARGLMAAELTGESHQLALRMVLPVVGAYVGYLFANRVTVVAAVSLDTERPYGKVMMEDWLTRERLTQDLATLVLAPLMVISYLAVGYPGVVLFFTPLALLNEAARRYLELQRAQQQVIHTERMAAKGEMAAEVGHELRNQLAAISGRAQMLVKDADRGNYANLLRHAQVILDQSSRMERLSKGLVDFSNQEMVVERVELNALVQRTVEFVRTQNRFDGVEWDLRLCDPAPELRGDLGQLQQVLVNLLMNAADEMNEAAAANGGRVKRIVIVTDKDEAKQEIRLRVTDSGRGIPKSNFAKIFEPHFTTKRDGHGFGLSTSYRIIANHGGRVVIDSPPGEGATFTIAIPQKKSGR